MRRGLQVTAVGVAAASVVSLVVATLGAGGSVAPMTGLAWPIPNIVVGALLTLRRPGQLVGWLFAAIGFLISSGQAAEGLAELGLQAAQPPWWGVAAAWYGEVYWISLIYAMLIFLPLLFPTGSAPSPRWRPVVQVVVATLVLITVTAALQEQLDTPSGLRTPNPIGIAGLPDVEEDPLGPFLLVVTVVFLVLALAAVVTRYRTRRDVERQQLKWFASAAVLLIIGFVAQGVVDAAFGTRIEALDVSLFALPPAAAAVAIFRYRLYAIDRLISRTVTYALVTAVLVGVYAAAVAIASAAIDPLAGESPLAIAVATLAAAAVFRPALTRIRRTVDRQFNRERYDAAQTIAAFRERVRNEVDLDSLTADLVQVADETFEPQSSAVWLRRSEEVPA